MKKFEYNLHVQGYASFEGHRVDLNFNVSDVANKEAGNHHDLRSLIEGKLLGAIDYEVTVQGYVSFYGLKLNIDENFHS